MGTYVLKKMKSSWLKMFASKCAEAETHVIWPEGCQKERAVPLQLHQVFVSTVFVLEFLINQELKGAAKVKGDAKQLLRNLLQLFCRGTWALPVNPTALTVADIPAEGVLQLQVADGEVQLGTISNEDAFKRRMANEHASRSNCHPVP